MAESNNITYDALMRDLKARKYAPVYYLMGDEPYYIDKVTDYIANNVLMEEERDFNQTILFGSDVSAATIVDAARRYPMMAERQVVIVKEAQNVKKTEPLESYINHPQPSTLLVMCHKGGVVDKRKAWGKAVMSRAVVMETKKMREYELPKFIENYLKPKGASIDPKSTQLIADSIGADLSRLTSELDKVLIALPEGDKRVTPVVVEEQIGVSKDFNAFELRDAIVNRNVFKANQIIKYFDENPKVGNIYSFLPMLFNYFQNLLIAYYCPQKGRPDALAKWLELRSVWAAKDYMTGMRNYTGVKTLQIISKIRELDAKSKGIDNPNTPAGELMKELIFFILH